MITKLIRSNFALLFFLLLMIAKPGFSQISYFPPLTGSTWDQASFNDFPYDSTFTDSMYNYLESKNSRAFIVLHDGKIVAEKYFGTFTQDSFWYWASAGKSLSAFLIGQARDQGLIEVGLPASHYLGTGWTSCTSTQEEAIKVWHLLTMSSGLDGQVPDVDCTDPACLKYKGDPGTLWFYHNAPYLLTHDVLEAASGKTMQNFTTQNLSLKTGITGLWAGTLFVSKPRSAARFGLLMLNEGIWNGDTLLKDRVYFDSLTTSSQAMNPAYGMLFWLNGKDTLMVPQSTLRLPASLNPAAPSDMYAALGKNDQKIYVVPSEKLVVVRMGEDPGDGLLGPSSFDQTLWEHINRWRQVPTGIKKISSSTRIYPNPCDTKLVLPPAAQKIQVYTLQGKLADIEINGNEINTRPLENGLYILRFETDGQVISSRFQVMH